MNNTSATSVAIVVKSNGVAIGTLKHYASGKYYFKVTRACDAANELLTRLVAYNKALDSLLESV